MQRWEYTTTKARARETLKGISRVARKKYAIFLPKTRLYATNTIAKIILYTSTRTIICMYNNILYRKV